MEGPVIKSNSSVFCRSDFHQSEHFVKVKEIFENVLNEEADIIIVTDDGTTVATHKILLSMFSRTLANIINKDETLQQGISIPVKTETVTNLINILTKGAVEIKSRDELREVASCANILGIALTELDIKSSDISEITEKEFEGDRKYCEETVAELELPHVNFVPVVEFKEENDDQKLLDCGVCGRIFMTSNELQVHMAEGNHEHGYEQSDLKLQDEQPPTIYKCEKCQRTFSFLKRYTDHKLQGTCDKPFICPQCHITVKSSKSLKKHMNNIHARPLIKCSECEEIYKTEIGLNKHMRRCHLQSSCEFCQKVFKNANTRRSHVFVCRVRRAGAGLPPISEKGAVKNYFKKCSLCHKAFHSRGGFNRHMNTHKLIGRKEFIKEEMIDVKQELMVPNEHSRNIDSQNLQLLTKKDDE